MESYLAFGGPHLIIKDDDCAIIELLVSRDRWSCISYNDFLKILTYNDSKGGVNHTAKSGMDAWFHNHLDCSHTSLI